VAFLQNFHSKIHSASQIFRIFSRKNFSQTTNFFFADLRNTGKVDVHNIDNIIDAIKVFWKFNYNLDCNDDGTVTVPAKKEINVFDKIYQIIQQNGVPMHLNDIFAEFKRMFPKHKYTEAKQLRPFIQQHESIVPVGKQSVYALKEWNVKTGSIRDLIVEFLFNNDLPQPSEKITEYVLQYFPKTNNASIRTTMFNDAQKRFTFFKNNLFGLSEKLYPPEYKKIALQERQRKTFEQSLSDFENFIKENKHFPFSTSKNDEEVKLYRWWNVQNNRPEKLSEQQSAEIERIKTQYGRH
jgi:hypothetical protein